VREAATRGRVELRDPYHPGLWLRVNKSGSRTWCLRARDAFTGKPHWFTLGQHPQMSLSEARKTADALRVDVRAGSNPIAERKQIQARARASAEADADPTDNLVRVVELYGALRGRELRSWERARKQLTRVFSPLLTRSLASITAAELQITADNYRSAQSASAAVRVLRPLLKWAAKRGYGAKDLAQIEPPARTRKRTRVLSRDELARVLPLLEADANHGICLKFVLLCATRLNEAAEAVWGEIDEMAGTWTIPGARTKNHQDHLLPLPRQAMELLRRIKPDSPAPDQRIFRNERGGRLDNWSREDKRFQARSGTSGWTRHDLRRTSATLLGALGEPPHVIEAVLNHIIHSNIASIYNRHRYTKEIGQALQRLADGFDTIERGSGAEVVPLRASA
jgi:integrase